MHALRAQSLNDVSANLEGLSESCSKIFQVLSASKAATSQLAAETERLQSSMEMVDVKVETVNRFLSQYQVSEQEVRITTFVPHQHPGRADAIPP